jgi:hypothetical protein
MVGMARRKSRPSLDLGPQKKFCTLPPAPPAPTGQAPTKTWPVAQCDLTFWTLASRKGSACPAGGPVGLGWSDPPPGRREGSQGSPGAFLGLLAHMGTRTCGGACPGRGRWPCPGRGQLPARPGRWPRAPRLGGGLPGPPTPVVRGATPWGMVARCAWWPHVQGGRLGRGGRSIRGGGGRLVRVNGHAPSRMPTCRWDPGQVYRCTRPQ